MLASALKVRFEDLRELDFGSITSSFVGVGSSFANPVRMLKVTNTTDQDMYISFNGVDTKDMVAARSAWIYDYGSNKITPSGILEQSAGERVYVKQIGVTAPTLGAIYVTVIYASTH